MIHSLATDISNVYIYIHINSNLPENKFSQKIKSSPKRNTCQNANIIANITLKFPNSCV